MNGPLTSTGNSRIVSTKPTRSITWAIPSRARATSRPRGLLEFADSTLEPLILLSRAPYADRTSRRGGASYAHVRRTVSVSSPSQDARLKTAAVRFAW